jgi:Myb/SANT-like DNA-binding domain
MANFDENHPDVLKKVFGAGVDDYDPMFGPWTMEMERLILDHLIGMKEQVERGAKKAKLSLSLPMFKESLQRRFGVSFNTAQIKIRIEEMMGRYDFWNNVLAEDGVYKDSEGKLVCIDTTITLIYGDELGPQRYHLYDLPPLFRMLDLAFGDKPMF